MNYPTATLLALVVYFGFFSSPAEAQVNLKLGYNFSLLSAPGADQIINSYNQQQNYSSGFRHPNWLHGLESGIRFKSDLHALELTYQGSFKTLKATGSDGTDDFTDKMRFAVHSLAVGYQVSDRKFGAGTDLQYQFYKTKFTSALINEDFTDNQNMFAVKFYFMITLTGKNGVDMAIQPYYVLPFGTYDTDPLAQYLQVEPSARHDRWDRFGFTVLFYNGVK